MLSFSHTILHVSPSLCFFLFDNAKRGRNNNGIKTKNGIVYALYMFYVLCCTFEMQASTQGEIKQKENYFMYIYISNHVRINCSRFQDF